MDPQIPLESTFWNSNRYEAACNTKRKKDQALNAVEVISKSNKSWRTSLRLRATAIAKARPSLKCRVAPLNDVRLQEWPLDVSRKTDQPIPIGLPQTVDAVRCVKVYASCAWLHKMVLSRYTFQVHESDIVGCVV